MSKQINIQGHRGARGLLPENTLQGFIKAVELGVDTLELDVVISGDQQVVVSHEAWMNEDICSLPDGAPIGNGRGREHNLYQMSYAEIRRFDCGKRGHPGFPQQVPISSYKPLLTEVITTVEAYTKQKAVRPVAYNIEIKTEGVDLAFNPSPRTFANLVNGEIKKHQLDGRVALQSFDVSVLQEVRKINGQVKIGLLVENQDGLEENLNRLGFIPFTYSPEFTLVDEHLVREVQSRGLKLIPWTVNEKKDMEHLIAIGADGIITDYPDKLIDLVKKTR